MYFIYACLLLLSCIGFAENSTKWVMIKDPVVDLYRRNVIELDPPVSYAGCSLASSKQCKRSCRSHQILFNEVVEVIQEEGSHLQIVCSNLVYGYDAISGNPSNTFWIEKEHVLFLDENFQQKVIPLIPSDKTLILVLPWDKYSAGTRFIRDVKRDTEKVYGIAYIENNLDNIIYAAVPKRLAREESSLSVKQKRELFVKLSYALIADAKEKMGVIPYVLGGSGYIFPYKDGDFFEVVGCFDRIGDRYPYVGYDCSELIFRLCAMSGIEFPYKTTGVIRKKLQVITQKEDLQEGDLLWYPGHVMIVSDLKKNEVIEVRGYESGYGDLHILPLSQCFAGVKSFADLYKAYEEKKPLTLLNKDQKPMRQLEEFLFLQLPAW